MKSNDISAIPSEKIQQIVLDVLAEKIGNRNFKVEVKKGANSGDNFIGIVYRVVATENDNNNHEIENGVNEFSCFLKVAPMIEARRERFMSRVCFIREIYTFHEILSTFREFQESRGIIPEENGFHEHAKCFRTIDEAPLETLIFEDLKVSGFEMIDYRQTEINYDYAELWAKAIGKYHALSFAMRDQQPEKFAEFTNAIPEVFIRKNDEHYTQYINSLGNMLYAILSSDDDAVLRNAVHDAMGESMVDYAHKICSGNVAEPYAVICHGDSWTNNMLFKFDSNLKPIDIRFVDFQITRYASPVCDLTYFLFICTTKEFRDVHYHKLLKVYHSTLSDLLKRLGSDPEKLFPFSALEEQLQRFGIFSILMASILLPFITTKDRIEVDLDEIALQKKRIITDTFKPLENPLYLKRMRGILADVQRLGYLKNAIGWNP